MAAEQDKKIRKAQHNVIIENRRSLTITGVMDIDSFDEETVIVFTEEGELTIKGVNLHINKIDVDTGDLLMEGEVDTLVYSDNLPGNKGGLFSRLFR
ncbi:MAG: sporulation protein YabP [Oscillospiraceae bacterium]|nr:sporulation protein YabP [Oscillospiraceae bacterium]